MGELKTTGNSKIDNALEIALNYAGFDGEHHKSWCIDQMVIALYGGEDSDAYKEFVYVYENPEEDNTEETLNSEEDEDEFGYDAGYSIYEWDKGIAP